MSESVGVEEVEEVELVVGERRVEVEGRDGRRSIDRVAVEEPLEMRIDGSPLAITMRTPGADEELVAGFLYGEGIVDRRDQILAIESCASVSDDLVSLGGESKRLASRIDVRLREEVDDAVLASARREFRATAACGVCGKQKLDDLAFERPELRPLDCHFDTLAALPERMREHQQLFDHTGGIHAAGLFDRSGDLLCIREDIGRHNAVDKVVGHFLLAGRLPLRDSILVVSGRAGFELVQKALRAAIPVLVAVGAASSLAVEMAADAGMSLYSFVGPGRGNRHV